MVVGGACLGDGRGTSGLEGVGWRGRVNHGITLEQIN